MKLVMLILLLLTSYTGQACSQADNGVPLDRGRTFKLQSKVLAETRTIDVSLPAGYATDTLHRYPVMFVMDGAYEHQLAAALAQFYADADKIPPMIVVGIRNPDRFRELTTPLAPGFPKPDATPNPGGAEKFLGFVGDELIPWVQRNYRTDSMRVLVGHSLGGLFALYTLSAKPDLFTGYVLMEPSAWWNGGKELNDAVATLKTPRGRTRRVMAVNMNSLGFDTTTWGGNSPMVRELSTTGENHTSMAAAGLSQSLRVMFEDFLPAEWKPGTRPIAMLNRQDSLSFRLGYPVPVPQGTFSTVARMSIDSRFYDDAAQIIDRMERVHGASAESKGLREKLRTDRANESPGFVQLEIPNRRPSAAQSKAFIGRWSLVGDGFHEIDVRASGDTIVVFDRQRMPNGMPWEGNRPVIQVTQDGVLEYGMPVFRGLAALLVLRGKIQPDGSMVVTKEVRGWVPKGPTADFSTREVFRRVSG